MTQVSFSRFTMTFTIAFTLSFTIYGLLAYNREFPPEIIASRGARGPLSK